MIGQNSILDHKKADYCSHQIELVELPEYKSVRAIAANEKLRERLGEDAAKVPTRSVPNQAT